MRVAHDAHLKTSGRLNTFTNDGFIPLQMQMPAGDAEFEVPHFRKSRRSYFCQSKILPFHLTYLSLRETVAPPSAGGNLAGIFTLVWKKQKLTRVLVHTQARNWTFEWESGRADAIPVGVSVIVGLIGGAF